jgi:uncharacterized protein (TIGR02145 family)
MGKIAFISITLSFLLTACLNKRVDESVNNGAAVKIGPLEWTTQNLNVINFANGDPIPEAKTDKEWKEAGDNGKPAWCYYNNDPENGKRFGKLYNWYAVDDPRGLCPDGWHIPRHDEWETLIDYFGGEEIAGGNLKEAGTANWESPNKGATNESGFTVLPAGGRYSSGVFYGLGRYGDFWTATGRMETTITGDVPGRNALSMYLSYMGSDIRTFSDDIKNTGLAVRCVRRISYSSEFDIVPSNTPNDGIMFVNHEPEGRSGHGASTITECKNGDIIAFYGNVSGTIIGGHGSYGWSEYKRSTDGGKTWSEPVILDYSKKVHDEGKGSALVWTVMTAPNGTIVAVITRFTGFTWQKNETPVYILSYDNGHTWTDPVEIDKSATVDQISMTYNASFVHDGELFVVFVGGGAGSPPGPYSLYVSSDNGETFQKRSDLPFPKEMSYLYSAGGVLDDGSIIVYTYPRSEDERYLPYVTSKDKGRTWSEIKTSFFEKRIRNPQLSEKIGDYYFIHGRSGSRGDDPRNLVLYASRDGIHWDSGIFLNKVQKGGDSYSANAVTGNYDSSKPKRLLIQSSIVYRGSKVNIKHWWIENIAGVK